MLEGASTSASRGLGYGNRMANVLTLLRHRAVQQANAKAQTLATQQVFGVQG